MRNSSVIMGNSRLYQMVTSENNIFTAIYSLESYIFEKRLLSKKDLNLFYRLRDKYDDKTIRQVIKECQKKLKAVLLSDEKFDVRVFFKAKKYDKENNKIDFRPIHTADLITQICIVSILNIIMFSIDKDGKRQLSDLSQLLPSNFYGNLPSSEFEGIFYHWKDKYKQYTEAVMTEYKSVRKNQTFKYEVVLDLKNFFPSIDPSIIFNFILEKTASIYSGVNEELFKSMLQKILCFNVKNLKTEHEINEYIGNINSSNYPTAASKGNSDLNTIGIPQGLPQAYYFGNIAMLLISKEFDKIFPGKSFYYVDDSVIYTNSENANSKNFKQSLEQLNYNIERELSKYTNIQICPSTHMNYNVLVHQEEKSSSAILQDATKMSRDFLVGIGLEASRVPFEINATMTEIEDRSISAKIECIYDALQKEIENVREHIDKVDALNNKKGLAQEENYKTYLKSLIRYKKFFGYRKRILEFRKDDDIDAIKSLFYEKFLNHKPISPSDFEKVFLYFDEDIFLPEATLILNRMTGSERGELIKAIKKFEKNLAPGFTKGTLYLHENFSKRAEFEDVRFSSLKKIAEDKLGFFTRKPEGIIIDKLSHILSTYSENSSKNPDIWLDFDKDYSYNTWVFKYSNAYKRNILNSYISTIFNIEVSNDIEFIKLDKRPLKYYELRILTYIRNRYVSIEEFIAFLTSVFSSLKDKNYEKVDFSLIEVLDIFKTHVRKAELIDDLILVHKYVSSIWRNGSRFLYFYTLHNQEHSVELIKSCVNISKIFDYFHIKSVDYYILFLACYLHDIAMVLQPDIDSFLEDNPKTDEVYSSYLKFKQDLFSDSHIDENHFENKSNVKKLMKDAFERLSYYFESLSRDNHVKSSADFIKKTQDLNFIDLSIRAVVSAVAAAHGANWMDVYGLKSNAKSDLISEKYMMILLRLADLLDIAKDRVSLNILERNIMNMPRISQYHWITHSAIDKFEIESKYVFKNKGIEGENFSSILRRENLMEIIVVQMYLNTSNLTSVRSLGCNGVSSKVKLKKDCIEIEVGKCKKCTCKCNFLCKWICHKNSYLLQELNALEQYLKHISSLTFTTEIKIRLIYKDSKALNSNYFDVVQEQIQ